MAAQVILRPEIKTVADLAGTAIDVNDDGPLQIT
jgi:hypothetical protein